MAATFGAFSDVSGVSGGDAGGLAAVGLRSGSNRYSIPLSVFLRTAGFCKLSKIHVINLHLA